ncbi:hypothetical protein HG537_0D03480 [Torulaspora globosa]|uniref:Cysteine-rich transmembrane domain-containing protein n=1 Tax=Torulaspora globosa TaxID=48254 RepID=A0A7H9HUD7_9SACH|nr:hypothetical protein HG537_0D03480 [Torulaspora sp. CBS 2947]
MSANEYYSQSEKKETFARPGAPPPGHGASNERGVFSQPPPQQQYYQQYPQPQYQQQPQYPQYYQQQPPHQQQPIYVQQQPPRSGNEDCLTACLAALCICCTLDLLF